MDIYCFIKFNKNVDMEVIIKCMQKYNYIPEKIFCINCKSIMKIYKDVSRNDKNIWACTICKKHKSLKFYTWGKEYRISILKVLKHIKFYIEDVPYTIVSKLLNTSENISKVIYEDLDKYNIFFYNNIKEFVMKKYHNENNLIKYFLDKEKDFNKIKKILSLRQTFALVFDVLQKSNNI